MSYYFTKSLDVNDFSQVIEHVKERLKEKGFGVLTEIDIQETLKKKIDVDFYKYKILGACNPHFAYKALQEEDKVGVMLPCNIIVQQKNPHDKIEVSAVNPLASMSSIDNKDLGEIASEVTEILNSVINSL